MYDEDPEVRRWLGGEDYEMAAEQRAAEQDGQDEAPAVPDFGDVLRQVMADPDSTPPPIGGGLLERIRRQHGDADDKESRR